MKFRKIVATLGITLVVLAGSLNVKAANVVQIPAQEIDTVYYQGIDSNKLTGWAEGPHIYSEAGIVMDADSGAILYAKNIDNQHYPASITKVLTALVALEHNELTKTVTITPDDYNFLKSGDNHIGLKNKEQITMEDALHGTLLASGNEVAHAVGSNTEGGYDNFIKLMNEKAAELGCTNSHFVNSHGLHDDEHYTSARDMALIASAAFHNEEFMRITGTKNYTIPETNITNEKRYLEQHHKMLFDWRDQYYEYCVGGKTGYTGRALNTLVTFASKDGVNLVSVVLRTHGTGNAYVDTRAMMDYAFANFSKVTVSTDMAQVYGMQSVDADSYVMLPNGIPFEDLECDVIMPTELEDRTGTLVYTYEGHPVGKVNMTVTDEYYNELHGIEEVEAETETKEKTTKKTEKKSGSKIVLKVILIIVSIVVILFLLLLCYVAYRRYQIRLRKKRKQKREIEFQKYVERMQNKDAEQ